MKEEEFQLQMFEKLEEVSQKMTALSAIMAQVEGRLSTIGSIISEGNKPSLNDQLKRIDAFLISIGEKMDMRIRQEK